MLSGCVSVIGAGVPPSMGVRRERELADGGGRVEARETPVLVALALYLASGSAGGGEWSVYLHAAAGRRPVLLERVDSRYAAEQAVKRWQSSMDEKGVAAALEERSPLRFDL